MSRQVIRLHPAAPPKPAESAPCNGCGVCCAAEPCPIGVLVSGRRTGACAALSWNEDAGFYRCGMVSAPRAVLPWLPAVLAPAVGRLARRWISAASGCDSSLAVEPAAWPISTTSGCDSSLAVEPAAWPISTTSGCDSSLIIETPARR